jgi:hypothetical protein
MTTPPIEITAAKEQLASRAILLGGKRTFGGVLPQRVTMNTQVLGGASRIKPLGRRIAIRVAEPRHNRVGNALNEH